MSTKIAISLKSRLTVALAFLAVIFLAGFSIRADAATTSYTYDSLNRLSTADYGTGLVINYTYDAAGNRLTQVVTSFAPIIGIQPAGTTINTGQTATLSVVASETGLSYQWYQGASGVTTTPVGTNSASYTTQSLTESTSYWVRVIGAGGLFSDSNSAVVVVSTAPSGNRLDLVKTGSGTITANDINSEIAPYGYYAPGTSVHVVLNASPGWCIASVTLSDYQPNPPLTDFERSLILAGLAGVPLINVSSSVEMNQNRQLSVVFQPLASFTYTTNNGAITITGYTGFVSSLTIPGSINGLPVTIIGESAFYGCTNLAIVTIPSSVTSIGSNAFASCPRLKSAVFVGNAPSMGGQVYDSTASGFTVFYQNGKTGFSSPSWNGYPAVNLGTLPGPIITSLNPTHGPAAGGNGVAITGSNFNGATLVNFGTVAATSFTVTSATQITAVAPAGMAGQKLDVSITAPGGTTASTAADDYTYDALIPGPTITGLNPTHGPAAGGTSVVISGSNFTGVTGLKFGTVVATSFTVNSATQITVAAPAGTAGHKADVSVTTPVGTSANTAADDYTYDQSAQTGSLQVNISPAGAITAGAQWNVDGQAWETSGTTVSGLSAGNHTVAFSAVNGWTRPGNQTATVSANQTTTSTGTYSPVLPAITTQPAGTTINTGQTATLSVVASGTGLSYQWYQGVSGVTTTPAGTNSASYTTPVLTATASYWVRVTNTAGSVDSNTATVSIALNRVIVLSGSLSFGNVTSGGSATATMTIANSGNSTLTVSAISYPAGFTGNWSGGTISSGSSKQVAVTFNPTSLAGYGGPITVSSDATSGNGTIMASGTGAIDATAPSIAITSPTSWPTYSWWAGGYAIYLSGTASDDVGVTRVEWSNNRGGSGTADGTIRWSVTHNGIGLQDGDNLLTVTAFDAAGNSRSATLLVSFTHWVDFTDFAGQYSGLVRTSGSDAVYAGRVQFTLTRRGAPYLTTSKGGFTGTLSYEGRVCPVSGNFNHDTHPQTMIIKNGIKAGYPSLNAGSFRLNDRNRDVIEGTLTAGSTAMLFTANRHLFNAKTNPCPNAGKYTVVLGRDENSSSAPRGQGIGTVTVSTSGAVRMSGKLANGTAITQSATLSKEGLWPFYAGLYAGTGYIAGPIAFGATAPNDLDGEMDWIKPARYADRYYKGGFQTRLTLSGNRYSKWQTVIKPGSRNLVLQDGDLSEIGKRVALSPPSKFTILDPAADKLKLTIGLSTGMITGSFIHPATGKAVTLQAVILQGQDRAAGFFLGTTESGLFEMDAVP